MADGVTPGHEPLGSCPYLLFRCDGTRSSRNDLLEAHNRSVGRSSG